MVVDPLRNDFKKFLRLVWAHLRLPEPTPVQYDIANYLQHGPKRLVIEAFRGVGKSWITVSFVCWLLYCDPQVKILVVSASKSLADNFSTFCLQLINDIPELQFLIPRDEQRNAKVQFDVGPARPAKDPSLRSVGITGQLTGSRADYIIGDDVETANNSMTQGMREHLAESIKEFDAILTTKEFARVMFLGTPQTEDSIYQELPSRGYRIRIWPARYPTGLQRINYGTHLSPSIEQYLDENPDAVGKPVDPARFTDTDLGEREASYGRSGFNLQFMLDTVMSDAQRYPLKLADLVVMNLNPENAPEKVVWASSPELSDKELPNVGFNGDRYYRPMAIQGLWVPYQGACMFVDPAGKGKDETGLSVVKYLNGQLFVMELTGLVGGYVVENLEKIAKLAKFHKVTIIRVETNFGDGMFEELLKPVMGRIYPCTIESYRSTGQKEKRIIDTLEPIMNSHKLIIDRKLIDLDVRSTAQYPSEKAREYQAFYQMTRLTRDRGSIRHDDRIEALAGACGYWVEQMARDVDKQMSKSHDERLMADLKGFMNQVIGVKPQPRNWIRTGFEGNRS